MLINKISMNRRDLNVIATVSAAGMLLAAGCGSGPEVNSPEFGGVITADPVQYEQFEQQSQCISTVSIDSKGYPVIGTSCSTSDVLIRTVAAKAITSASCYLSQGKNIIADQGYLEDHSHYPSDFPLISKGKTTEGNIACSVSANIPADVAENVRVGSTVTTAFLIEYNLPYYA